MRSRVLLIDPKYPHNVGNALRACAVLGASELLWTGSRVRHPDRWGPGERLPREERLRDYRSVVLTHAGGDVLSELGTVCHRFVCIPGTTRTPLNLAAAVNIVLYDRIAKQIRDHGSIVDEPAAAVRP
jgi:tRNA C32,U32 (ribose-2'-O)-methylase TrmJ